MGELKVVAKYGTPEEAHLLRNRLAEAGIPAYIDGDATAGWATPFANALGGAKLLVAEEDFDAAKAVISPERAEPTDRRAETAPSASWHCPRCGAEVDAAMDVCWSCDFLPEMDDAPEITDWDVSDDVSPEPEPEERRALAPEVAMFVVLFPPTLAFFLFSKLCAVLAPLVPDVRHHPAEEPRGPEGAAPPEAEHAAGEAAEGEARPVDELAGREQRALDALVLRAWRAAVIGVVAFPPLVTLYSTFLLVRYWSRRRRAHPKRDRRAGWALVVNVLVVTGLAFLLFVALPRIWGSRQPRGPEAPPSTGPVEEDRTDYLAP